MENEADGKEKNKRMYIDVANQRNTSQSLNKEASAFRLKHSGKNIETEYAANLSLYFDQSRSVSNLTLSDLRNVLTGLSGTQENPIVETQQLPTSSSSRTIF